MNRIDPLLPAGSEKLPFTQNLLILLSRKKNVFMAANFALFFISGCFPSVKQVEQKIERLQQADAQHQKMLAQELNADSDNSPALPKAKPQTSVTLEEGDSSPPWVTALPPECEENLYCGLAFVDHCENANSCREEAETKARDDLRKRIAVRIRSQTSSRTYAELDATSERGHKTFQSEIRERAVSIELKDVRFTHFYLRPDKQLQTLARMERPKEAGPGKKKAPYPKALSGEIPPLLLAFTDDEKTPNLNKPETQTLFQQRFREALRLENVVLLENGTYRGWEALRGKALRQRAMEALTGFPESVVVVLSLSGRLDAYEGRMFKGLATVFLNVAAYGEEGAPLFRKSFTARRFMVKSPDNLTDARRQEQFSRTVEKGLNEFEDALSAELKQALLSRQ